ncbi:MAG: hypothetical protein ACKO9G_15225, partial [Dolichospermum sp.]
MHIWENKINISISCLSPVTFPQYGNLFCTTTYSLKIYKKSSSAAEVFLIPDSETESTSADHCE